MKATNLVFLPSGLISLFILLVTLILFFVFKYKTWRTKSLDVSGTVLLVFVLIPTLAFLSQKTNSGAYLLMLFPQWIIFIAYSINKLMTTSIRAFIFGTLLMLVGLINIYILLRENFFTHRTINDQLEVVNLIIKESNSSEFNILGRGVNSQYESFVTSYKYLLWYLGYPASEKTEKLKFYVSELPDKIKIEVEN